MACHSNAFLTLAVGGVGKKPFGFDLVTVLELVNSPSSADVTCVVAICCWRALKSLPSFRVAKMYPTPRPMYGSNGLSGRNLTRPLSCTGTFVIWPTCTNSLETFGVGTPVR